MSAKSEKITTTSPDIAYRQTPPSTTTADVLRQTDARAQFVHVEKPLKRKCPSFSGVFPYY